MTTGYYEEVEYVPNTENEVSIFLIASSKKKVWYTRILRRSSKGGYYRRSLKTTSRDIARRRSIEYWIDLRRAEKAGVDKAVRSTFEPVVREWIESRRANGYSITATRTVEYQFNNHFLPFFKSMDLDAINERSYIKYLNQYRLNPEKYVGMRKLPTIRTLETEQSNFKSFLRWCVVRGYRSSPVQLRSVLKHQLDMIWDHRKVNGNPQERRDIVSTEVYSTYRRYLRSARPGAKQENETRSQFFARRRMHFYFLTIYNFVARAGAEVLTLRFKDLELIESNMQKNSFYVRMTTKGGKKVKRPGYGSTDSLVYHSDYNYAGYLAEWINVLETGDGVFPEWNRWESFPTNPDDFVFPAWNPKKPMNAMATTRYMKTLRPKVLSWSSSSNKNHTEKLEEEIKAFTPYSVRHIAIRNLIAESNQSFSTVAERANTSIKMIEDFYYKYGVKPEGRLVSKHPSPSPENTRYLEGDAAGVLQQIFRVTPASKS
tara:strand:- start:1722 stop:3182 length:1461 start_codon:yes stop_codon:yes gene_type:complete